MQQPSPPPSLPLPPKAPRLDFLNSSPPPNYVAGLGRGATGFTSRSDIGPARSAPDLPDRSTAVIGVAAAAAAPSAGGARRKGEDEEDDKEADAVWEAIDRRMDSRRKDRREARLKGEIEKYRAANPKITELFDDLKRKLHTISAEEWESIPEIGDYSSKNKTAIRITAAKLEEANGNTGMVMKIIEREIRALQREGVVIDRETWMKEAEAAEWAGSVATCHAIINNTIGIGVEEEDRKRTWLADAEECKKRGSIETARAILQEAYAAIPNLEEIWLAAFKLEFENHEPEKARTLLAKARERGGTERVWMKSAIVERELGNVEEERGLLDDGLKLFPSFFKLWLMRGQLEERLGNMEKARKIYDSGINHCPNCITLWLSLADLEEKKNVLSRARAVLTLARKKNPQNPELWLAAVRAEARHGNKKEADRLMAKALQECPNSGILWAASIEMVPRPQRKSKSMDAFKRCDHDPHVIAAMAKLFWHDRKVDKARKCLNRAVTLAPDIGDFWALYYKFELEHGTEENQKDVLKRCIAAEPKHGEKWQAISKAVENSHQPTEAILIVAVVNPKGYLTDLKITRDAEISDIKKARLLLKSFTQTIPKHPPGWIAAARLEEVAGKIGAARALIEKGCEECPTSEDVWLEACRLASPEDAKGVIARGVETAKLEHDVMVKRRVLMKGLEKIPDSVRMWKAVVDLCNEKEAKVFLRRAVGSCPLHVELWLALARLETTYLDARAVLNTARGKLPKEPAIRINAAKLEEANGNTGMVMKIIERDIRALQREGVVIDRETWMKEAEAAERAGFVATCQAIIKNTIGIGVEEEDRKRTWVADAEECKKRGSIETARAIYAHALTVFWTKKSIWLKATQLEKAHGTRESLDALLCKAVTYRPQDEVLWLMGAKEKWLAGDVLSARAILKEAYAAIPNSEEILLAAFKLEFENLQPERARMLLAKARERGGTERIWMKSAILERELGNVEEEKRLLDEGLNRFPSFFKLWLMRGQLEERLFWLETGIADLRRPLKFYDSGTKQCPNCIPLWLSLSWLEDRRCGLGRAQAVLTLARKKNPQNPELWLAAIRAEARHGNKEEVEMLMANALQDCPNSGILWAASIEMAPRPQLTSKCMDAVKRCKEDPHFIAAVAKVLWHDGVVDVARTRLNKAVTLAPDIGDFWALYYKFELEHGTEENQKDVLKRCIAAEPKHGEKWQRISKAVEFSHQPTEAILEEVIAGRILVLVETPTIFSP